MKTLSRQTTTTTATTVTPRYSCRSQLRSESILHSSPRLMKYESRYPRLLHLIRSDRRAPACNSDLPEVRGSAGSVTNYQDAIFPSFSVPLPESLNVFSMTAEPVWAEPSSFSGLDSPGRMSLFPPASRSCSETTLPSTG